MNARDFYNDHYDQFLVLSNDDIAGKLTRVYRFAEAYHEYMKKQEDDPEMDGTDYAHPAGWRGNEHAHLMFVDQVNKILDGELANKGTSSMPWEALRQRLYDIRTLLGIAEYIIRTIESSRVPKMCKTRITTWDKIRADYDRRRKDAERS